MHGLFIKREHAERHRGARYLRRAAEIRDHARRAQRKEAAQPLAVARLHPFVGDEHDGASALGEHCGRLLHVIAVQVRAELRRGVAAEQRLYGREVLAADVRRLGDYQVEFLAVHDAVDEDAAPREMSVRGRCAVFQHERGAQRVERRGGAVCGAKAVCDKFRREPPGAPPRGAEVFVELYARLGELFDEGERYLPVRHRYVAEAH